MKSFKQYLQEEKSQNFEKWFSGSKMIENGKPKVFYHGTREDFDKFENQKTAFGFYFTDDYDSAEYYTGGKDGKVLEVYLNIQNPAYFDDYNTFKKIGEEAIWKLTEIPNEEAYKFIVKKILEWSEKDDNIYELTVDKNFYGNYDEINYSDMEDFLDEIEDEFPDQHKKITDYLKDNMRILEIDEAWQTYEEMTQNWYMEYQDDFVSTAKELGYDGVIMADVKGGGGVSTSYVVFDDDQIWIKKN